MAKPNVADTITIGLAQVAPVWLNRLHTMEKILDQVVQVEAGHLDSLCETAKEHHSAVVLGIIWQ